MIFLPKRTKQTLFVAWLYTHFILYSVYVFGGPCHLSSLQHLFSSENSLLIQLRERVYSKYWNYELEFPSPKRRNAPLNMLLDFVHLRQYEWVRAWQPAHWLVSQRVVNVRSSLGHFVISNTHRIDFRAAWLLHLSNSFTFNREDLSGHLRPNPPPLCRLMSDLICGLPKVLPEQVPARYCRKKGTLNVN